MEKTQKLTQSQIDGVQYRHAKLWQIILYATNALCGMTVYTLMNSYANYIAGLGYAITAVTAGMIITGTRILDAVTDPLLALIYDKVDTKLGRLRILLIGGFLLEAVALLLMYDVMPKLNLTGAAGFIVYVILYVLYIFGYTAQNMTAQTLPAIMSNDPKQRPTIGVWVTGFNYLVPIVLSVVTNIVLLPKFGGQINLEFMSAVAKLFMLLGFIGVILVSIGVSEYDKPEYYKGVVKQEPLKIWGSLNADSSAVVPAAAPVISAQCLRVPASDGHMAAVSVSFTRKPEFQEMLDAWANWKTLPQELQLPSAPTPFVQYMTEDNRPQTRLDRDFARGMGVSVGRLRPDHIFDWRFVCLSHNTLRGAAGGGVLSAELLCAQNYIQRKV